MHGLFGVLRVGSVKGGGGVSRVIHNATSLQHVQFKAVQCDRNFNTNYYVTENYCLDWQTVCFCYEL